MRRANWQSALRLSWIASIALIAIGLFVLVAQLVEWEALELLFLPGLGLIFLVWGSVARSVGLLIPGGILSGIGLGVYLMAGPLSGLEGEAGGRCSSSSFAAGWALITLLSAVVCRKTPLVAAHADGGEAEAAQDEAPGSWFSPILADIRPGQHGVEEPGQGEKGLLDVHPLRVIPSVLMRLAVPNRAYLCQAALRRLEGPTCEAGFQSPAVQPRQINECRTLPASPPRLPVR